MLGWECQDGKRWGGEYLGEDALGGCPGVVLSQLLPQDGTLVLGAPGGYYFTGESFLPALPPRLVLPGGSLWVGYPKSATRSGTGSPGRVAACAPSVLVLPAAVSPRAGVLGGDGHDPRALPRHVPAVAGEPRAPHGAGVRGLRGRVPG